MKKYAIGLLAILIIYTSVDIYANKTGRATRTSILSAGCSGSGCHGGSKSNLTQLAATSSSGSFTLKPEETATFNIRVSNTTAAGAGLNAAIKTSITGEDNIGTLTAGTGTKTLVGEITHSVPKAMADGYTDFDFSWKAPKTPGKYYLRAVACAVNMNDQAETSEPWNWMEPVEIIVKGITITEPKSGMDFCVNTPAYIRWNLAGVSNVNIELSTDGGNSWFHTIVSNFNAVGGVYIWNVPSDFRQGDNYRIRIIDTSDPTVFSISDRFGIYGQFTITKDPIPATLCVGDNYTMWVEVEGTGMKYQWRKDGQPIPGATDSIYTIKDVKANGDGFYGVLVSSPCNIIMPSKDARIDVRPLTNITLQPNSTNACLGQEISFNIDADGHSVEYQWYRSGTEIKGATGKTLTISEVKNEDAGDYTCRVTGYCKPVLTSNVAKLVIKSPARITRHPESHTVCERTNVQLRVEASGLEIRYSWYFNDKTIGGNSPTLDLNNINPSNAGHYYCIVFNGCGNPDTSRKVTINVDPLPRITSQTNIQQIMVGEKINLRITAINTDSYQWYKNNQIIPEATEPDFIIENAQVEDGGDYRCLLKNKCGDVNSIVIKVNVLLPQPGPRLQFKTSSMNFGDLPLLYEREISDYYIYNTGDQDLLIDSIRLEGLHTDQFSLLSVADSIIVAPGDSAVLSCSYLPTIAGQVSAYLKFYSNSITDAGLFNLYGFGGIFNVISNRRSVFFGTIEIGQLETREFMLVNQSNYKVTVNGFGVLCQNGNATFKLTNPELPFDIGVASSQIVAVEYSPLSEGEIDCIGNFHFEGIDSTLKVEFQGNGLPASINESDKMFILYPNPANDYIELIFDNTELFPVAGPHEIRIFNILGELILTKKIQTESNTLRLDLSKLTTGIYYIKIGNKYKRFGIVR